MTDMPIEEYYMECLTCNGEIFDNWKYDHISESGHEGHNLRKFTQDEVLNEAYDCLDDGCLKQSYCSPQNHRQDKLMELIKNDV